MRIRLSLLLTASLLLGLISLSPAANSLNTNLEIQAITDSNSGEVRLTFNSKISRAAVRSYQITATPNTPSAASYSKTFTRKVSGYISQRITALTPGTDYKFKVSIRTTSNRLINSADFNFYTASTRPTIPVITRAFETDSDEAVVYFDAPANDGQTPVLYYTAVATPGGATGTTLQQGSGSITITGLTKSTTYTFTITAHNINGTSVESRPSAPVTTLANKIIRVVAASSSSGSTLAAPAFTLSSSSQSVTVNSAITTVTNTPSGGTIASYAISPAAPAGLTFSNSTGQLSGTPTSTQSSTAYTITATNASGSATRTFTLTVTAIVYTVGQTGPGGGKIFYYDAAGFTCGVTYSSTCTYLEVAPSVSTARTNWSNTTLQNTSTPNSTGTAIGTGHRNTAVVVAAGATESATSAIAFSDQYVAPNGTSDWFLPSKDEMATLVANASAGSVSLIPSSSYWTSSQSTVAANQVWNVTSTTGALNEWYKNQGYFLAPIRAG
jgi:stage V sporulation protein SpoVS